MERIGMKAKLLYEGDLHAEVLAKINYGNYYGFIIRPEISIEGLPDEIPVSFGVPAQDVKKGLGNYWGAHIRKGDRIFMKGMVSEGEIIHWGIKKVSANCSFLYNKDIKSGYGIRKLKTKKSYFKGQIDGKITDLIPTMGFYQKNIKFSSESFYEHAFNFKYNSRLDMERCNFNSIGFKLDDEIAGIPEEITVHLSQELIFRLGDEAKIEGELYSVKLEDSDFEIFEMQAKHYLNKTLNFGF